LMIEGENSLNHTVITGGAAGKPIWDFAGVQRITLKNLAFTPAPGVQPSCGVLIGRVATESAGNHVFDNIYTYGNFTVAGVYAIASEINTFRNCHFWRNADDVNDRACFYSAKTAVSIFGTITSSFSTLTATGDGGNGNNVWDGCSFIDYSTNAGGVPLVHEYGQATTIRGCNISTFGATDQVQLLKGLTGMNWSMNSVERFNAPSPNGIAIRGTGVYQNIRISGYTFPIYAIDAAIVSDLTMENVTVQAGAAQQVINVDILEASHFRISEQLPEYGLGRIDFTFNVRTSATNCDFGVDDSRVTVGGILYYGGTPYLTRVQSAAVTAINLYLGSNFNVMSTTTLGTGVGGALALGGLAYTGSNLKVGYGAVAGVKANGTSGNLDGELRFYTAEDAVGSVERLRMTKGGLLTYYDVEVGTSARGVILTSPGGTRYKIVVDNAGALSTVVA